MRMRNSEGYWDPTAGIALTRVEKYERSKKNMNLKRGDIYYIESVYNAVGSEQRSGRPAIIVSNEKNNAHSGTVEVVYLTTQPKTDLPTHVTIHSVSRESTALCEQITTVSTERIGDYKGTLTSQEQMNVDIAIMISLDLSMDKPSDKLKRPETKMEPEKPAEKPVEKPVRVIAPPDTEKVEALEKKLAAAEAKCCMLQEMYESLLAKALCGAK